MPDSPISIGSVGWEMQEGAPGSELGDGGREGLALRYPCLWHLLIRLYQGLQFYIWRQLDCRRNLCTHPGNRSGGASEAEVNQGVHSRIPLLCSPAGWSTSLDYAQLMGLQLPSTLQPRALLGLMGVVGQSIWGGTHVAQTILSTPWHSCGTAKSRG